MKKKEADAKLQEKVSTHKNGARRELDFVTTAEEAPKDLTEGNGAADNNAVISQNSPSATKRSRESYESVSKFPFI